MERRFQTPKPPPGTPTTDRPASGPPWLASLPAHVLSRSLEIFLQIFLQKKLTEVQREKLNEVLYCAKSRVILPYNITRALGFVFVALVVAIGKTTVSKTEVRGSNPRRGAKQEVSKGD